MENEISREAAEWVWKYGRIIARLPDRQFNRWMKVLQMLSDKRITVEEAIILAGG